MRRIFEQSECDAFGRCHKDFLFGEAVAFLCGSALLFFFLIYLFIFRKYNCIRVQHSERTPGPRVCSISKPLARVAALSMVAERTGTQCLIHKWVVYVNSWQTGVLAALVTERRVLPELAFGWYLERSCVINSARRQNVCFFFFRKKCASFCVCVCMYVYLQVT